MSTIKFSSIDPHYFSSSMAVGGRGGIAFNINTNPQEGVEKNVTVKALTFWYDKDCIQGLHVQLTNGTNYYQGRKVGLETDDFYLASDERLTSIKLWRSNFQTGRLGGVSITTNKERTFNCRNTSGTPDYEPEVGSGLLVGVFGHSDWSIDCLGFATLRTLTSVRMIDLDYPNISTFQVVPEPSDIKTITYDNTEGDTPQTFTFSGEETVQTTSYWSATAGIEVGYSVEVQGSIPLVASFKVTTSVKASFSYTAGQSRTQTTTEAFSFPITVPAGGKIQARAILYMGNIDTEYTATMIYNLDSGVSFQYTTQGMYKGVASDEVRVEFDDLTNNQ